MALSVLMANWIEVEKMIVRLDVLIRESWQMSSYGYRRQ